MFDHQTLFEAFLFFTIVQPLFWSQIQALSLKMLFFYSNAISIEVLKETRYSMLFTFAFSLNLDVYVKLLKQNISTTFLMFS